MTIRIRLVLTAFVAALLAASSTIALTRAMGPGNSRDLGQRKASSIAENQPITRDSARISSQGGTSSATLVDYPGVGAHFAQPPAGTTPSISAAQAISSFEASHVMNGVASQASGAPAVKLALFYDDTNGDLRPDGTVKLSYQGTLVWAIIYHEVPISDTHPVMGSRTDIEDVVAVVDASSGRLLQVFTDVPA
jgi:hypothetical protein